MYVTANRDGTSHVLEEDAVVCAEETLHHREARRMLREDLIDFEFFTKLLSLKCSGLWDLDHDARMDLVDKGDASFPDPVHTRKLALAAHNMSNMRSDTRRAGAQENVLCFRRGVSEEKKGGAGP